MKSKFLIFIVIFMTLINCIFPSISNPLAEAAAPSSNLGIANDYNVFVLNNHYQSYSDAEGRVAVGNEAKYIGYGIGDKLSNSTDRFDLVVGKKINITGGTNFNGNTAIGTQGTVINYTMTNNNREDNPIVADVIDFDAAYSSLKSTSIAWSTLTPNGTVEDAYGTLIFTGTNEALNVFSVTTDQLALGKIYGIKFNVPETATVLVNVFGTSLSMGNLQIFYKDSAATGNNAGKWMWNFPELETLDLRGMSMYGSVLAPDCTFSPSGSGNFNGTVVFQNFYNEAAGGYESHHYPFNGKIIPTELNNSDMGRIVLTKVDAKDQSPLSGAEFTLTKSGEVIGKATTDQEGKASFTDLPYGTYELQETKAPEGYVLSEDVTKVTIGEEQSEYSFTFTNEKVAEKKGSISILKVDEANRSPLSGAEFTLTQNGEVVGKATTDQEGKASFIDLPYGKYELQETKAPEGYVLSKDVKEVIISDEQSEYSFTFTNKKIPDDNGSNGEGTVPPNDNGSNGEGTVPPDDDESNGEGTVPPNDNDSNGWGTVPPDDNESDGEGTVPPDNNESDGEGTVPPDNDESDGEGTVPPNDNQSNSFDNDSTMLPQTGEEWLRYMMAAGIFLLLASAVVFSTKSNRMNKIS